MKRPRKDFEGDVKYHLSASANRSLMEILFILVYRQPVSLRGSESNCFRAGQNTQFFHKDKERKKVVPVLIHGDAAFAAKVLSQNVLQCQGYQDITLRTIHIIVNNQIGFTTAQRCKISPYPSDLAKMVQAPILHVNGDDPKTVVHYFKIATEFRQKFNRDVVIDMVCYRRFVITKVTTSFSTFNV